MLTYHKTPHPEGKKPFLSIITRVYKRPVGLSANLASVQSLEDQDAEQIFITDNIGLGLLHANTSFSHDQTRELIEGDYVFLLDDDDFIVNPRMITDLKTIVATQDAPDVIFFRMIIKNGMNDNYYPTAECWGNKPIIAHVGGSCFVVRRETWLKHIHNFSHARCGDFYFINSIFESGATCYWMNVLCAETGKVSRGGAE